jgi:phosphoglycolate phosphatase
MKYPLVIFDSDGTLADTLSWMRGVFNEIAGQHGLKSVTEERYAQIRDLHGRELLKALGLPLWKLPRLIRDVRARMEKSANQFSVYPGIAESLQRLAAGGARLAIVSSNSRRNVERVLGPATGALIHHYDCGASMFGKATKVRRVVRKSGLVDAIYIGDEIRDAEAAREAGVAFGAVAWGHHRIEILREQNPDELFVTPFEIAERLL